MSRIGAGKTDRLRIVVRRIRRVILNRTAQFGDLEAVCILMLPLNRALGAEYAQTDVAFMADRNLGCPQQSGDIVRILTQNRRVALHLQLRRNVIELRKHALRRQSGCRLDEELDVRADIRGRLRFACARRIQTPHRVGTLLLARLSQCIGQPLLRIFRIDVGDLTDIAALNHLARLTDHRIAGIGIGDGKRQIALLSDARKFLRLLYREGERLVTHEREILLQKCLGNLVVCVIRRDDDDKIQTVFAGLFSLFLRHYLIVRINTAEVGYTPRFRLSASLFRVAAETARGQLRHKVDRRSAHMHRRNTAAGAADHTKFQFHYDTLPFFFIFSLQAKVCLLLL